MVLRQKVQYWIDEEGLSIVAGQPVIIRLTANFPRKAGQRPDGDNCLKNAQDAIAEAFGVGQRGDYGFLSQVVEVTHDNEEGGELIYEVIIPNGKDDSIT